MALGVEEDIQTPDATWTVDPRGPGYMPLCGAAMWIATKGLLVEIDPYDEAAVTAALEELADQLLSGDIRVVGYRDGKPDLVPAHLFSCPIAYLPSAVGEERAASEQIVLRSWAYDDDASWADGFDDCLADRSQTYWGLLRVNRADIWKLWPFDDIRRAEALALTRTGAPGRPSGMHLVLAEHQRRMASGEALRGLSDEASCLANWLARTYSMVPQPSTKTIANKIGPAHRKHQKPRK